MADEMIFCPFCGKRLAANASFCVYCGKQIPVSHSQSMNRKSSEESKSNGNRKLTTIILAIIALLFVGLGVKFALGGSNSGSAKNANYTGSTTKNIAVAPVTYSGWKTVTIGDVASLQYPPTMEVQNDKYRSILGTKAPGHNEVIIQQYGLNDMTPEGRSRYARVLFKTKNSDIKVPLNEKLTFSKSDLDELGIVFYDSLKPEMNLISGRILTKQPTQIKTINGIDCLYNTYTRQMKNNPVVIVHSYHYFNNQYVHQITISYRESEKSYWNAPDNDVRNVVNTLKINPL